MVNDRKCSASLIRDDAPPDVKVRYPVIARPLLESHHSSGTFSLLAHKLMMKAWWESIHACFEHSNVQGHVWQEVSFTW